MVFAIFSIHTISVGLISGCSTDIIVCILLCNEAHARCEIIETTDVSHAQEENADFREGLPGRGHLVVTEAALMMLNSLEGDNWLAMEDVSLDRFDTMNAFDEFYKVFDRDYQYNPEQELPARMEELVTGFHRHRAEPLRL